MTEQIKRQHGDVLHFFMYFSSCNYNYFDYSGDAKKCKFFVCTHASTDLNIHVYTKTYSGRILQKLMKM